MSVNCTCGGDSTKHRIEEVSSGTIVGGTNQFCETFFHVLPCNEFGIRDHLCLQKQGRCQHRQISIIVRVLNDEGKDLLVVKYDNCIDVVRLQRKPKHAEEIMVEDDTLLCPGAKKIVVLAQLQPCHHSGGMDNEPTDPRSCTELVIIWYLQKLRPAGISLTFLCANLYRAPWVFTEQELKKTPAHKRCHKGATNARKGLALLKKAGISVDAIDADNWEWLMQHTHQLRVITDGEWDQRLQADEAMSTYLSAL